MRGKNQRTGVTAWGGVHEPIPVESKGCKRSRLLSDYLVASGNIFALRYTEPLIGSDSLLYYRLISLRVCRLIENFTKMIEKRINIPPFLIKKLLHHHEPPKFTA